MRHRVQYPVPYAACRVRRQVGLRQAGLPLAEFLLVGPAAQAVDPHAEPAAGGSEFAAPRRAAAYEARRQVAEAAAEPARVAPSSVARAPSLARVLAVALRPAGATAVRVASPNAEQRAEAAQPDAVAAAEVARPGAEVGVAEA